ncbi:acyl-[acyl-carrier-protein]-phospholipid O-acyltransferase/long-chain-fatty-acid--[acyl-carrier-protein] ligase [Sphingobium sp. B1D7B]|uniref:acyl-[ACP]--phospholipid O-acyltransferase n=1 Tax=unclassified Sphingobium TaxID=2611147 RepID=UPI002224BFB6|nr:MULTISPECIES: acyl-[ACP]--phospholipid O-acyltransferase [unclassified Sphingobium]MCW2392430.1 acyl-[acyl-carrier-protein]-phospholipid O-acyltransferase/long-chain-fatty-acid--[acyl-carrier-protein] ligase [Sphingobium sp. B11D3A]MCW2404125.1 acyl-[acyl-carrier-protein]-phospholipid O-acyltransferase/long-chain-fatty-acid--[acyl-carrier-protein] ligase [Sphingobium sp. B1D7B]
MSAPEFSLLTKRRFAPIFVVQFLGAFNDNLLKFALLFLATFSLYKGDASQAGLLSVIASGIFIAPYFLFSALAGQIADARDKAALVRFVKAAEIGIMGIGLAGFWFESVPVLLVALFLMGMHSTLFGPVKYSIIPQHLRENEVVGGVGLIEAGTFLAILGGQLLAQQIPPWEAGVIATGLAVIGFLVALAVPAAPATAPGLKIDVNIFASTWNILKAARHGRGVWLSILGISWFFAVGAVLLSQFGPLVSGVLMANKDVATLFLVVFSISVAMGSLLVNALLKGEVSARYVPISALLMSAFMVDLWLSSSAFQSVVLDAGVPAFLATPGSWRIIFDLLGLAVAGGMFIVPLYTILQTHSPSEERSRTIAANNIVNAAVSVLVVIVATVLLSTGTTVPGVIGALGFATLSVALISCWLLPETIFKVIVRSILKVLYRVELFGAENMPRAGEPAVVVVNHVSFLDGLLLAAFLPGKPTFAVHTRIAKAWWLKPFLPLFDAFPVDPTNPLSAKAMVKAVREGRTLVIFPEGRITVTGALMKVFDGPGMVADKADAPIIPVRIDGAQFTPFSRLKGKVRLRRFPKIRLTVLPARRFSIEGDHSARTRRAIAGRRLYDEMSQMIFDTSSTRMTLFEALLEAREVHAGETEVVEDVKREPMSYDRLIIASLALARPLNETTRRGEAVGLLMPNVSGVVATFFALQSGGRVPAMLNYTAGLASIRAACTAAQVLTIISARAFVTQAKLTDLVSALEADGLAFVWLEDVGAQIGLGAKLRAKLASRSALSRHKRLGLSPDTPAVILFTSGSEGLPKGVVLTHRNLLSNCRQLAARIDFNASDVVLNALPVFHSFGLTGGTLLPIFHGVKTVLYPSPLHYRIVPALAYDANATILFGTDTFLSGYARMAHGYDFYSLRYIFAGAERVRDETRKAYAEKFGLRILEGYGATEAGPVIAVNTPMHFRSGTVGRLLPGIEARLDDVPGIEEGGRLSIRGPNIMAGYMKADAPGDLQPPEGGWHDTGDIVTIDDEGFVTIRGRAKRFAKIGGEMISLPAVEAYAAKVWPEAEHAVVTRPDPKKGEQLVMFTTAKDANFAAFQSWGRANGVTELSLPRDIRVLDALPVLGTGKLDYVKMGELAAT